MITSTEEDFVHLATGISLCHQSFGSAANPPLVLVMGLGMGLPAWPDEFCALLAAEGFHVIRFDNRDIGRSTVLTHRPVTTTDAVRAWSRIGSAPYSIRDMSDDLAGLIDELDLTGAHIVGVSLGGMIAQQFAIDHPELTMSLSSLMSSTGNRRVGWTNPKLYPGLLRHSPRTADEYVSATLAGTRLTASPAFPPDVDAIEDLARRQWARGLTEGGVLRQTLAVLSQNDRTAELAEVRAPAFVFHGSRDRTVHVSGGRATARALPNADYLQIAGLAHDLPRGLYTEIIDGIVRAASRA